jgi:hypothetical protein
MTVLKRLLPRNRVSLTTIVCILLIALPPAIAYAGTNFTYMQGVNQVNGYWGTPGYSPRDYNRVWHYPGYYWNPFYCPTSGPCFGGNSGSDNPTYANGSAGYAKAYCQNLSDNSGVTWTCQSTH